MSLGPWIIWYLTHRSIWQHRGVVNSQRAFVLIMKGGAGLSPKCQHSCRFRYSRSLWESQSQHLLSQTLSIYLSGEYIPCVASPFYNNQFWKNRKKKGASHNEWLELHTSYTVPATCLHQPHYSSCLPPSVVCQGTGPGILWSLIPRATCPTIANLQSAEDNSKERMGPDQLCHTQHGRSRQSEHCGTFKETHISFWPQWSSKGTETSPHKQKQHLQLSAKFPLAHLIANWRKKNTTHSSLAERLPVLE